MKIVNYVLMGIVAILSFCIVAIAAYTYSETKTVIMLEEIEQAMLLPSVSTPIIADDDSSLIAVDGGGAVARCKKICDAAYLRCLKRATSCPDPMYCSQICHNGLMNCHSWCENNPGADLVKGWTPYFETVWDYFRYYDACPERLPLEYGVI